MVATATPLATASMEAPRARYTYGMKNFYDITKGQLITFWIFGIIGFICALAISMDGYSDTNIPTFLSVFIPFFVIFYSLGWSKANRK